MKINISGIHGTELLALYEGYDWYYIPELTNKIIDKICNLQSKKTLTVLQAEYLANNCTDIVLHQINGVIDTKDFIVFDCLDNSRCDNDYIVGVLLNYGGVLC